MPKETVLVPLDSSQLSRTILPFVHKIFPPDRYRLVVLKVISHTMEELEEIVIPPSHAAREWTPQMYDLVEAWRAQKHDSLEHKQEELLKSVEGSLRVETKPLVEAGYDVRVTVVLGDPFTSIEEALEEEEVFAVAMATHAREGFDRLLHGSIAGKLLHDHDIPLLLYHPN